MANYQIDPAHSEIGFKVRHMMITNVSGHFNNFTATMEASKPDFSDASITFEADVNSINTHNEMRDGHLKGPDFFDAEQFPKLTFKSTGVTKKDDANFQLHGDLSIRGVSKPVTLDVEYGGTDTFHGMTKAGFELTGKINRKEFGLNFNATTETGGVVVADEVKITANVQMVKQA